ncbi:MAG TPA: LysM domain-containing protein [Gammaproteobacteria bacterium]
MLMTRLIGLLAGLLLSAAVCAQDTLLRPDHPSEYVVQKGDTLWDIAGRFLREPWYWPEIWHVNPQVENPHLIFPGDKLVLDWVDGKPMLRVQRGKDLKLSPQVRSEPIDRAIAAIPLEHILAFIGRDRAVVSLDEINRAPYIVQMEEGRVIGGADTRVYVRSIDAAPPASYSIYRPGQELRAHGSNELLGYLVTHVGDANLVAPGDPAKVDLASTNREVLIGDRLAPLGDERLPRHFYPHAPDFDASGRIIAVLDGVSLIEQYATVVIDRGSRDGYEQGLALATFSATQQVRDTVSGKPNDMVTLPREKTGELLVYRVFDRVSYALVMQIERPLRVHDEVGNP